MLLIGLGAGVLAVLLGVWVLLLSGKKPSESKPAEQVLTHRSCPLCGSALMSGQKVLSRIYRTKAVDQIMEITGCPNCSPTESGKVSKIPRFCPVCKKQLLPQQVVTARVFTPAGKKMHVHVLGCPQCRKAT